MTSSATTCLPISVAAIRNSMIGVRLVRPHDAAARERAGTAIVLRGLMGTGKTVLGDVMGSLVAPHYFLVDDPRYVTGQFNAHMSACLLLQADEAVWARDKTAEGRL